MSWTISGKVLSDTSRFACCRNWRVSLAEGLESWRRAPLVKVVIKLPLVANLKYQHQEVSKLGRNLTEGQRWLNNWETQELPEDELARQMANIPFPITTISSENHLQRQPYYLVLSLLAPNAYHDTVWTYKRSKSVSKIHHDEHLAWSFDTALIRSSAYQKWSSKVSCCDT